MIIYDERQKQSLFEFGIEIPVHDSRAINTFQQLKDHPRLGPHIKTWHIDSINEKITRDDLQRVHSRGFVENLFSDRLEQEIIRTYELIDDNGRYHRYDPANASQPLINLFDRILLKVAATVQCCRVALNSGFCFSFGGGNHHAQLDYGAGFCLLNDIVIAVRKLQAEDVIRTAWVIDLDAHKGDGTAALTLEDDSIKTLSIHMAHGWPLDGEPYDSDGNLNPSFTASDIDIPVEAGQDDMYLDLLQEGLRTLEKNALPDLAMVVSGVDPYEKDELPSADELKLSLAQMKQRDQRVYSFLKERRIPRAYLMAGGYGEKSWEVYTQFLEWVLLDRLDTFYLSSFSKK
ncbi:MAG: histone deacetylase [Deltaproteobacteria bacterium]|jgi:acetoin utilization deacetylase AcuC-like enzyme|nr:histone deacetylase [Deltaproteobacteria bacterium]